MGLFDRFFGGEEGETTTKVRLAGDLRADRIDVHLGETRFRCRFETNGSWVAAVGGASLGEEGHRLFLFDLEEGVRYVMALTEPTDLALSSDGTVGIADEQRQGDGDQTLFFVLDDVGTVLVEQGIDGHPGSVALTDDGRYAAVQSSRETAVFHLPDGDLVTELEADEGDQRGLCFREGRGRWELVLTEEAEAGNRAAGDGEVLWRSPR